MTLPKLKSIPLSRNTVDQNELSGNKFIRRSDLTAQVRLLIASTAFLAQKLGIWGVITKLSREYMISRTFIYILLHQVEETGGIIFGDNSLKPNAIEKKLSFQAMLSFRFEGKCSLNAISTIMKRFNLPLSSVGGISQHLHFFGSLAPHTLTTEGNEIQLVVFTSDELFSKRIPILVTVDPVSSAILKIELADSRTAEDWKNHWECLEENGFFAVYLVSDEGTGLTTAQKEYLVDIFRQPDTYHAIAHQLGLWKNRLENQALKAIEYEYDRYNKIDSAVSDEIIQKRFDEYEKAVNAANEAIERYEDFCYLYKSILNELDIFNENGTLRDRKNAENNIEEYLALLDTLGHEKITKATAKIRNTMPDLLNFFDVAKSVVEELNDLQIDQQAIQALCLAWQWGKGVMNSKKAKARKYCSVNEQDCLEFAVGLLQEDFDHVKEEVYRKLYQIVQSSALVECINSIIRPYLNTAKNHITQETLNLIMFYHNHRRYIDGKRKGKTPIELLTGKEQKKDWIELLFEIVEEKHPSFFDSNK